MKRFSVGSVFAAALFAAAGSARAQDEAPFIEFGIRASVIAHSTYEFGEDANHHYGLGFGYGAGVILKHTVSDELNFRGEPSFYYRSLYSYKSGSASVTVDEMAFCLPLMVNYFVSLDRPIYISGGLEVDVPFKTQYVVNVSNATDISDQRSAVDVGFLIGAGYMIIEKVGVDARYVVYFNNPRKEYSELLMSYGIGVFLLF